MTKDEKNRLIHEKLLEKCWHGSGEMDYGAKCPKCGVYKTGVSYISNPNYCGSHELIAQAREKVAEKGWQLEFVSALAKILAMRESESDMAWELVNASPADQADAICEMLLEEK